MSIILVVAIIMIVVGFVSLFYKQRYLSGVFLACGIILAFATGVTIGYSRIPPVGSFAGQLSAGVLYTAVTSFSRGKDEVLVVKSNGDTYRIISVKIWGQPPHQFALIGGKPVTVVTTKVKRD